MADVEIESETGYRNGRAPVGATRQAALEMRLVITPVHWPTVRPAEDHLPGASLHPG